MSTPNPPIDPSAPSISVDAKKVAEDKAKKDAEAAANPSIGVAAPSVDAKAAADAAEKAKKDAASKPSIGVGAPGGVFPSIGVPMPGKKGLELSGGDKEGPELASGEDKKKKDEEKFEGGDLTWDKWFERLFSGVLNAGAKFLKNWVADPLKKYVGAPIKKRIIDPVVDPAKAWVNKNIVDPIKSRFNKYIADPISRFFKTWENLGKETSSETEAPSKSQTTQSETLASASTTARASVAAQQDNDLKQVDADARERQEAGEGLKHGETGSTPAYDTKLAAEPGIHKMSQDMDQAEKERKAQEEVKIESDHQTPKLGGHQ